MTDTNEGRASVIAGPGSELGDATADGLFTIKAYGAYAADKPLEPIDIGRRQAGPHDVQIDIAYCGVCHSDLHQVRSEWQGTL